MKAEENININKIWLHLLGSANVVYFLKYAEGLKDRKEIINTFTDLTRKPLYGIDTVIHKHWGTKRKKTIPLPDIKPLKYIFPVYSDTIDTGFIIPLEIKAADSWHVSDAFASYNRLFPDESPFEQLMSLLALVEQEWEEKFSTILPLRWLQPLQLKILCPVHMDIFKGESMQVPLLINVLRALCSLRTQDPFNGIPVFATGFLNKNGSFGRVYKVVDKLEAFVRELGAGHIAILSKAQINQLSEYPALKSQVTLYQADHIKDLFKIDALKNSLVQLSNAYHPSMNEQLIRTSIDLSGKIEFDQVQRISKWVLSHVQSPHYRFQFYCDLALTYGHRGELIELKQNAERAYKLIKKHNKFFGIDDYGFLIVTFTNQAIDSFWPQLLMSIMESIEDGQIALMSGLRRVQVLGSLCQFYKMFGYFDKAIKYGEQSIPLAETVFSSTAYRSRNNLIHALIATYRESGNRTEAWLSKASTLLKESKTIWAPKENKKSLQVHLGFCLHYEAEIARLSNQPFFVQDSPNVDGFWSHPWLFTLLSCARNKENSFKQRKLAAENLVRFSGKAKTKNGYKTLFGLFHPVYKIFNAALNRESTKPFVKEINDWLNYMEKVGIPGWKNHLKPLLKTEMDVQETETLCDAIRYH